MIKLIRNCFYKPTGNRFSVYCQLYSSGTEGEYLQNVIYPPILDLSEKEVKSRKREAIFEKYKALDTVEEKLFAINLPKYYGWNSLVLTEGAYPFNILPFYQHITRTRVYKTNQETFSAALRVDKDACKEIIEKLRGPIQEAILFELKGRRCVVESDEFNTKLSDSEFQNAVGSYIVSHLHRLISSHLCTSHEYLLESTIDYKPRLEAFWAVGGFHPSPEIVAQREEEKLSEDKKNELVEHFIQYFGKPCLQVRTKEPIPVLDTSVLSSDVTPIPTVNYDPSSAYGLTFKRRHGTNIPGFWPGDNNEFGLLSYHLCGHLLDRPPDFGSEETDDTLVAQAVISSFSWLLGQACYQGFSTFHDMTYPLVSQSVITDGRCFSFYLYQLNTLLFHSEWLEKNPRENVCIALPHAPLYQEIDKDSFIGWDDSVLENLIMFYLNEPKKRNIDMSPNVNPSIRHLSDLQENERRVWLHNQFRHMYSNRPRCRPTYEIYDWERIYKIKFQTRPIEARQRPFELDANPLEDRKYYDHVPPYVPKKLRPKKYHWKGWRAKFAKTYYPEIEFD